MLRLERSGRKAVQVQVLSNAPGKVAQWQSSRFTSDRLQVQVLSLSPMEGNAGMDWPLS